MSNHRFRHLVETHTALVQSSPILAVPPFVPCPVTSLMTVSHQSQVLEIYRIAVERTQAQLEVRTRRRAIPEFSRN